MHDMTITLTWNIAAAQRKIEPNWLPCQAKKKTKSNPLYPWFFLNQITKHVTLVNLSLFHVRLKQNRIYVHAIIEHYCHIAVSIHKIKVMAEFCIPGRGIDYDSIDSTEQTKMWRLNHQRWCTVTGHNNWVHVTKGKCLQLTSFHEYNNFAKISCFSKRFRETNVPETHRFQHALNVIEATTIPFPTVDVRIFIGFPNVKLKVILEQCLWPAW